LRNPPAYVPILSVIPAYVGKYRILEEIGRGGMGEVYLAEDAIHKNRVALKLLPEFLSKNESFQERFARECRALRGLDHPGIPKHLEDGEVDGRRYFTMEYVEGRMLSTLLESHPDRVNEKLIQDVLYTVAKALAYAHGRGILHRDVSPRNILVAKSGEVKLIDFGISKLADEITLTATGQHLGTPAFMAPEQFSAPGAGDVDGRADVWSLGVVGFQMLTGRLPFPGETQITLMRKILDPAVPVPAVLEVHPSAPASPARIVDRALQKNRAHRYESAEAMARALEQPNELPDETFSPSQRYWPNQIVYLLHAKRWALVEEEGAFGEWTYFGFARQGGDVSRRVCGSGSAVQLAPEAKCTECRGRMTTARFCSACGLIAKDAVSLCLPVIARGRAAQTSGPGRSNKKRILAAAGAIAAVGVGLFFWLRQRPTAKDPTVYAGTTGRTPVQSSIIVPVDPSKININAAPLKELGRIPGLGKKDAQQIILLREIAGPFQSLDDLFMMPGISGKDMQALKPLAYAGAAAEKLPMRPKVNLNTATLDELKKIFPKLDVHDSLEPLLEYRNTRKHFRALEEIANVPGFETFEKRYWLVSRLATVTP